MIEYIISISNQMKILIMPSNRHALTTKYQGHEF